MEDITREEQYLRALSGEDVNLPDPVTRREYFLAKAAGMDVVTPEPITREEIYLSQIQGGGGAEVEELTVAANGTYTADEGKAYSPVVVIVANTYNAQQAGKVVKFNSVRNKYELINQETTKSLNENGVYDTTYDRQVTVSIPQTSKFYAAIYKDDVITDVYINTDQTTDGYMSALTSIFMTVTTSKKIFGELKFYYVTNGYELRQGTTVIAQFAVSGLSLMSVTWLTDHVHLTNSFTALYDGGLSSGSAGEMMKIFAKAPLLYGHLTSNGGE